MARLFVQGATEGEVASTFGVSVHTVRENRKRFRQWMALLGHSDLGHVLGLRRAMRAEGMLEGVELI